MSKIHLATLNLDQISPPHWDDGAEAYITLLCHDGEWRRRGDHFPTPHQEPVNFPPDRLPLLAGDEFFLFEP